MFDERGILLSNVRNRGLLTSLGLLSGDTKAPLNLQLLDPGRELKKGQTATPGTSLRPTRMVASAVTGSSGIELDGYRNYLGRRVIGAWTWLDRHNMGIGTEIEYEEAYAPVRFASLAASLLFASVVFLAGASSVSSYMNLRLQSAVVDARRVGPYTLQKLVGQGGMGKVFLAKHAMLRRPTAIKVLVGEQADAETVQRFEREVQLTSQLTHPNTIQIYDYGRTEEGIFYYAMEYLDGLDLAQLVALEGPVPVGRAMSILIQACSSLREAHEHGLIHRDVKPANIMLCERGGRFDVVKVLDFGLAKPLTPQDGTYASHPELIGGTPHFMAPERIKNSAAVDGRSDLFSLGVVAYFLLTGEYVFDGDSPLEVIDSVLNSDPTRPSSVTKSRIPSELDDLVVHCLAKNPHDRPPSVEAFSIKLESIAQDHPWSQDDAKRFWKTMQRKLAIVQTRHSSTRYVAGPTAIGRS